MSICNKTIYNGIVDIYKFSALNHVGVVDVVDIQMEIWGE